MIGAPLLNHITSKLEPKSSPIDSASTLDADALRSTDVSLDATFAEAEDSTEDINDFLDANAPVDALYSAHDYTILSILTALGVKQYETLLGFGAFITFEVHEYQGTT